MQQSESITKLAQALSLALAEMEEVVRDGENPHFKSRYATLPAVLQAIRPVLAKHKLALVQVPGWNEGRCTVHSRIIHESGEWVGGTSEAPLQKQDAQGVGSAITYLRRYSVMSLCGIGAEDDDGNEAASPATKQEPKQDAFAAAMAKLEQCSSMDALKAAFTSISHQRWTEAQMKTLTGLKDQRKAELSEGKNG